MNCTNLDTLVLPENLENISNSAFKDCSNLVNITFGSKVKFIGANIFTGCSSISSIYVNEEYKDELVVLFEDASLDKYIDKIKTIK